jgi:hypothetical protein
VSSTRACVRLSLTGRDEGRERPMLPKRCYGCDQDLLADAAGLVRIREIDSNGAVSYARVEFCAACAPALRVLLLQVKRVLAEMREP